MEFVYLAVGLAVVAAAVVFGLRARRPKLEDDDEPLLEASPAELAATPRRGGLADRFFVGLARSREALARSIGSGGVDEASLTSLEEALIATDVGVRAAAEIVDAVRRRGRDGGALKTHLRAELLRRLGPKSPLATSEDAPLVILVVGINGGGKTTTIGKLAARYKGLGQSVVLAAGDTFRAGAIEQLKIWGERAGVDVVAQQEGADPAAVIFDAIHSGRARGAQVVICDTAGRLQAQKPLMDQLGKITRVIDKAHPGAPHEVLLVLDATIGQNALSQARTFREVVGVTGVALTKLDGTARGGVVVAVRDELGIPVKLVGLGEGVHDLRDFDPEAFVDALLGHEAS